MRDALLGFFNGKDFDFVLGDQWELAARLFARAVKGKTIPWDFNQIRVIIKENGQPISVDFALQRGEDIKHDLLRRDFTINSMAISVASLCTEQHPDIIDVSGGQRDLQEKCIRTNGPDAFNQDPLRILRAVRFARALNFNIEAKTRSLMQEKAYLLHDVAKERVKRELFAILQFPRAGSAIRELIQLDILTQLIPKLRYFTETHQGIPHQYDLMEHSLKTVEFLSTITEHPENFFPGYATRLTDYLNEYVEAGIITRRSLLMLAGFLHDCGKSLTRTVEKGRVRFLGHEHVGQEVIDQIARLLRLGKKARSILATITVNHMRILQLSTLTTVTAPAQRRLLRDSADAPLEVLLLALADAQATSTDKTYNQAITRIQLLVGELVQAFFISEHENKTRPLVTGKDVMRLMGIPEGQAVGTILQEIAESERTGAFNSRAEVLKWLRKRKRSKSNS